MPLIKSTRAAAGLLLLCWPALACRPQEGRGDAPAARTAKQPAEAGRAAEAPAAPFASVPRMKVEEAAAASKAGRALLVDVRPAEAFQEEHVEGAVSLPEEEVAGRGGELPKDKLIIVYCA